MEENKAYSSWWATKVDVGEGERDVKRWWWRWLVLHMIWENEEEKEEKAERRRKQWIRTQLRCGGGVHKSRSRKRRKRSKKTRLRDVAWVT